MLTALPVFYTSILTIFLLLLSWLLSLQLKMIFLLESQFKYFLDKSKNEMLSTEEKLAFTKICIAKKCFIKAIIVSYLAIKNDLMPSGSCNNLIIAKFYNLLGLIYYEAEQSKLAQNFYEQAIKSDSRYVAALNNLAKIYEDAQKFKKAKILYDNILSIDENNQIAQVRKKFFEEKINT